MADPYQRGSDLEWQKAENDELRHQMKKRERSIVLCQLVAFVLTLALVWVVIKFVRSGHRIEELLRW